ncbi:MAG: chorismate-binding protein, partial [Actinobacteria bacterium]|nr:chorismate-binding protein [Actinomycetota bacterium]
TMALIAAQESSPRGVYCGAAGWVAAGDEGLSARFSVAIRTATFLLAEMRTPEGRLYRSWKDGDARLPGYLEDYTHVAEGLLCLYELTFAARWFEHARALMETVLARFSAPGGGFHDTAADHEELVVRPRDVQDNAVPSGNAMAAAVLVRLAALSGEPRYAKSAEDTLSTMGDLPARYPTAYGQWLVALESAVGPRREVAVVGPTDAPQTRALLAAACAGYRPFQVTAFRQPGEPTPVGILAGRQPPPGEAAAWVCADRACLPPITDAEALRQALE